MRARLLLLIGIPLAFTVLMMTPAFAADVAPTPTGTALKAGLSVEEIVERLEQNNERRATALRAYEGRRSYSLNYRGFPFDRDAQEDVVVHYSAPESKNFDVISEQGSKLIQSKVFAKLLEGEREASHMEVQRLTALTRENYAFTLLGTRPTDFGGCYRLGVKPRRANKFLYSGEICVNAADFAVESIDAEPARNPSFWIKKTQIHHRYQKIGQFWLPASNETVTSVRLGGTATLNILYSAYQLR